MEGVATALRSWMSFLFADQLESVACFAVATKVLMQLENCGLAETKLQLQVLPSQFLFPNDIVLRATIVGFCELHKFFFSNMIKAIQNI
jgi:hypothetical protein